MNRLKIPAAPSVRRLPAYLHLVKQAQEEGYDFISGTVIAQELNLEPIQVRKDFAITGITGVPKRGFPVAPLIAAIERFLGWDAKRNAVIVGAGNLATALTGYQEFKFHGLHFLAAFDSDEAKVGGDIHGVAIYAVRDLAEMTARLDAKIAALTVPSAAAQETAAAIVGAGIRAIWNFTNVKIKVPDGVSVQREDLTSGYAMLCVMMQPHAPRVKE
jgi:redox-sensing transcriptional repressor